MVIANYVLDRMLRKDDCDRPKYKQSSLLAIARFNPFPGSRPHTLPQKSAKNLLIFDEFPSIAEVAASIETKASSGKSPREDLMKIP